MTMDQMPQREVHLDELLGPEKRRQVEREVNQKIREAQHDPAKVCVLMLRGPDEPEGAIFVTWRANAPRYLAKCRIDEQFNELVDRLELGVREAPTDGLTIPFCICGPDGSVFLLLTIVQPPPEAEPWTP
jgi:hypothetical protein